MKEKTTAILTLGCIFSLFFYYKISSPNHQDIAVDNTISENEVVQQLIEKVENKNVENQISESFLEVESSDEEKSECLLIQAEIDAMTFSETFKYHRECNGSGTLFTWNNKEYSTLLASEKKSTNQDQVVKQSSIPKVVDPNHIELHKEVLDATVGNK